MILEENSDALTRMAEALLEREVLDAGEIELVVKGDPLPAPVPTPSGSEPEPDTTAETTEDVRKKSTPDEGPILPPEPGKQPA